MPIETGQTATDAGALSGARNIAVWDVTTRVFHWLLVITVAAAWWTAGKSGIWHELLGSVAGGLVVFRIFWGFGGSRHTRFRDFVTSPFDAIGYLISLVRGKPRF